MDMASSVLLEKTYPDMVGAELLLPVVGGRIIPVANITPKAEDRTMTPTTTARIFAFIRFSPRRAGSLRGYARKADRVAWRKPALSLRADEFRNRKCPR